MRCSAITAKNPAITATLALPECRGYFIRHLRRPKNFHLNQWFVRLHPEVSTLAQLLIWFLHNTGADTILSAH
jgi:hypothetical protein